MVDCGGNLGPNRDRRKEEHCMFSEEQRKIAIETCIRYDHSYTDTVTEFGYPTRATLRLWWRSASRPARSRWARAIESQSSRTIRHMPPWDTTSS